MPSEEHEFSPGERWTHLEMLRTHYAAFPDFLHDVMTDLLGFQCSDIQLDIAEFLENGPQFRMIQAQRGQAKTTITAAYAVWRLVHNPSTRVLIVSAGGDMAAEIAKWVIQIIMHMPELECMRPDRSSGDRVSGKAFDVHYDLKGPEKSPSVACIGITSSMQGRRADLLIADDIESSKNSYTEVQRERLRHLTRDFVSICRDGDIVYLGTPQTIDSVYNGLASRGFTIRIWPGRYPTVDEENHYGPWLAPLVRTRMELDPDLRIGGGPTGERGHPIDPIMMDEDALCKKEIDQGKAYFNLQYMLSTKLMDSERFPLKSDKLVFMRVPAQSAPIEIFYSSKPENRIYTPSDWPIEEKYYRADGFGAEFAPFSGCHMYVDPAGGGQNGDQTAYAVTKFSAGTVFLVAVGGVPGGYSEEVMHKITEIAVRWKPHQLDIEDNYGKGAFKEVLSPILMKKHKCTIQPVWETHQKELRIINTLEPIIGAQRLVIDEQVLADQSAAAQGYPTEKVASYNFFYQLARITRESGALVHDDQLDAVAGSCRHWQDHLKLDSTRSVKRAREDRWREMMQNPLGDGRALPGWNKMTRAQGVRAGFGNRQNKPDYLAKLHRR